jgi:hypothetical protein
MKKRHVSPEQLADFLEHNRGKPIPSEVYDHIIRGLRGLIKKPRGRKPHYLKEYRTFVAPLMYKRYVSWLEKRQKRSGLKGWSCIQNKPWWRGSPAKRAALITMHKLGWRNVTVRHIQNIASSYKE